MYDANMQVRCSFSCVQAGDSVITAQEPDQDIQLHNALRTGNTERAMQLLADGVSATKKNGDGMTPLDTAAKAATSDNTECFKDIFNEAIRIEREKGEQESDVIKKWNDALKSIKADPKEGRVQLRNTIEEMSPVE